MDHHTMRLFFAVFLFFYSSITFSSDASNDEAQQHYEKALQYLAAGKLKSAEIEVKNSLQIEVNYLPARLLLGEVLLQTGNYQAAEKELEQALKLKADTFAVIMPLVKVKLFLNKTEQALLLLSQHDQLKNDVEYYYLQGNAYKAQQNTDDAEFAYQQVIKLHGERVEVLTAIADLWYQQEKIAAALAKINEALLLQKNYLPALLLRVEIQKNLGNFTDALLQVEEVLLLEPENQQALFAKANILLLQNNLSDALILALQLRDLFPDDPYAKLLHLSIIAQQGQSKQARRLLVDIKQQLSGINVQHINDRQVLLLSATVDFINENSYLAKKQFNRYIELYGENSAARRYLAIIEFRLKRFDKAEYQIKKALHKNPNNTELYILAAEIYLQAGHKQQYFDILAKAYQKFSNDKVVEQHYISALLSQQKFEQAMTILEKDGDHSYIENRTILAFLQIKSGLLAEAKKTTQQLLNDYPNKIEILQLAGELSLKLGRTQHAKKFFMQAIKLDSEFEPALLALAGIDLQKGLFKQVEQYYQQLLTFNAHNSLVLQLYADLALKQSRLALAIKLLEAVNTNNYKKGRALVTLYLDTNQLNKAEKLLAELLHESPLDESLLLIKSHLQADLGQDFAAKKSLKILFGLVYDNPLKLQTLAHEQLNLKDIFAAKKTLERIITLDPQQSLSYLQARLFLMNNELDQSERLINSTVNTDVKLSKAINEETLQWLELKVHLLLAQKKLVDATKLLEELYIINNNRQHMQLLAQLYNEQSQANKLMELLTHWLQNTPLDAWAVAQINMQAIVQGNNKLAIEVLESYPLLDENPLFLNNLANLYLKKKEVDRAEIYAEKAYKLAPQLAAINDTLGWVYVQNNKAKKGLRLLREANARDINNGEIHYHIAYALVELNQVEQAKLQLKQAVNLNPKHELRKIISSKISTKNNL